MQDCLLKVEASSYIVAGKRELKSVNSIVNPVTILAQVRVFIKACFQSTVRELRRSII
jgi:hypothetical protein